MTMATAPIRSGNRQARTLARLTVAVLAMTLLAGMANARSNTYRVELLLFQRVAPDLMQEDISKQTSDWLPEYGVPLWVDTGWDGRVSDTPDAAVGGDGQPMTEAPDISRLPTGNIRLSNIRDALNRSSDYEVLEFTSWRDDFPPGYKTTPLVVDLTERFDGERAIRGYIDIERRRFLHVQANLYDLRPLDNGTETEADMAVRRAALEETLSSGLEAAGDEEGIPLISAPLQQEPQWQTTTWLRELRRMRSQEIHYLDSPTIGLIVYFHPIDD